MASDLTPVEDQMAETIGQSHAFLQTVIETLPAPLLVVGRPAAPLRPVHWGLRILLAEDSLVNQKLATALLEEQGHAVTVVDSGRKAVAAFLSAEFDLVLMDVQMPEMDGLEATARIRAYEQQTGAHIPIIAMTAPQAVLEDRQLCLQAGMDGYLAKPVHADELCAAIAAQASALSDRPSR